MPEQGNGLEPARFWFNVRTGKVETDDQKSQSKDLMGPYATAAEASQALQSARGHTQRWDEEDRRWREGGDAEE